MNLFQIDPHLMVTQKPEQSTFAPHTHDFFEIFYFLSGDAVYSVEGTIYPLLPGDIIIMRNAETHNLILKSNAPYHRISIHFNPSKEMSKDLFETFMYPFVERPLGIYNQYTAAQFNNPNWQYYLKNVCETDNTVKRQVYLMTFLQELTDCFQILKDEPTYVSKNSIVEITHYIDRHLTDELNLDIICKRFFLSKSQLTRNFKKNLGTTVGEYINTKRLLLAHNLINEGQKPTAVYLNCGFHDYSSFFRAYKKKFGYKPKTTKDNIFLE